MKKKLSRPQREPENALPSPITASDYARLSPTERTAYRPVDPRYERLPKACFWLYGLALLCLIIYIIQLCSPTFSDFFNQTVGAAFRSLLALFTAWFPFSLGEALILSLPVTIFLLLRHAVRYRCDTWRAALVFVAILLSIVATLFSSFVLVFSAGYRGTTLDHKLGLNRTEVSAEELYSTAAILKNEINALETEIAFGGDDFSVMPYTLDELNAKLRDAYDVFCEDHDFISNSYSRVKPVLISEAMSYMHITGVYSFFTGEANLNVNFPDYTVPFTAAHEMAHQRGIAREDEASFIAYLVCIGSDDPYIRYSGYLNVYEYVASALYKADVDLYADVQTSLAYDVRLEMQAYNDFFEKYRGSTASKVSGVVNDTFLQIQGTPGTASYGMVVDLTVAYYRPSDNGG